MLRVTDLTGKDIQRSKQNHETYKMLYEKCVACIKQRNDLGHVWLRHTVPGYVPGRPLFSLDHAKRYIREKLERGKFKVDEFEGDLIICWGEQKEKAIRKQAGVKRSKKRRPSKRASSPDARKTGPNDQKNKRKIEEPLSVRLARLNFNMKHKK
jgi:hypothetical protein